MSGLLRRLAARAMGVAPTVRPVVRWTTPAAQPPYAEGFPSLEAGESRHETSPLPAAEQPPEASREAPRVGATEPPGFLEVPVLRSRAESSTAERGPAVEGDSYPDLSPRESRQGAQEQRTASSIRARAAERPALQDATAARAQVDDGEPVGPPAVGRRSAPRASAPAEVPTLLPPRPPAQMLPQRPVATPIPSPVNIAKPAIEETTEVHVSIGRIELTAVHEAPPKRREPARTRKPRSLEEYLAARQERPR